MITTMVIHWGTHLNYDDKLHLHNDKNVYQNLLA